MSLLAPPLNKRARWYWRAIQTVVLTAAVIVGLAVCSVLSVASYYLVEKRATPVEIYHNSWLAVRNNLHDQTRLKDWDSWEHRFDDQIKTDEDAIFYARKMVESLDDPYTAILDPHQTKASYDGAFGKFVGVGIEFDVLTTPRGDVVTTPDGRVLPRVTQEGFPVTRSILRGSPAVNRRQDNRRTFSR